MDHGSLPRGVYHGALRVTGDGGAAVYRDIPVTLVVTAELAVYATSPPAGGYGTIQAAIDAAWEGDTVLLNDGQYRGAGNVNVTFRGKGITVRSANGPSATTINCENAASTRGFIFNSGESPASILIGVTVMNANAGGPGGGASVSWSAPQIVNSRFLSNNASSGGGLSATSSWLTVRDSLFAYNTAPYGAGASVGSNTVMTGCTLPTTPPPTAPASTSPASR